MTANEIRKLMKDKQVHQWQVAQKIGVSEFTLIRWLREEINYDREKKILDAINEFGGKNL